MVEGDVVSSIYAEYRQHQAERLSHGLPPLALNRDQVEAAIASLSLARGFPLIEACDLLRTRVRPGIDPGAALKAKFLSDVATGATHSDLLSRKDAVRWLGMMVSGYAVDYLVYLLANVEVCDEAAFALGKLVHIYDQFETVRLLADEGVESARELMELWACESWLAATAPIPEQISVRLLRAEGETTTDDLSPAGDVSTRVDIPLHAQAMLKFGKGGVEPDQYGVRGPMKLLEELKSSGAQLAFCGDIVGTGSSRASATNSLMWHFGVDLPGYPNRRTRAVCIARQFAPIFLNTQRDYGALPVIADVDGLSTGQEITLLTREGIMTSAGQPDRPFSFGAGQTLLEARIGGRINLVLGRQLTNRARSYLAKVSTSATTPVSAAPDVAYTQAQKIVGRATGRAGVSPGEYCEPKVSSIALPDDAGPSTADELSDLGCRRFLADFVLQSFCHTAAYPGPRDVEVQKWLPRAIEARGGVVLRPGDGIIHSWLNRLLVPDEMGTGADSHTRFPLGLSFPAASNLVAFTAATGTLPLVMPESVLVRFVGKLKSHLTVRDMVHAIPMVAREKGLIDLSKTQRKNIFSGRLIEVEGVDWLSVESAFEICDATAERGAVGTTIALAPERVIEHVKGGVSLIDELLASGYGDQQALRRRRAQLEHWIARPNLLKADEGASYAAEVVVDLDALWEPVLCCPNDPDDAKLLSHIGPVSIDEVFLGSCMTTVSHFSDAGRAIGEGEPVPVRFWAAPPTRMAEQQLRDDGTYTVLERTGARLEMPGCSLCMGNQARVGDGAVVVSTSTRNFPNRMGNGAQVYLSSARVAGLAARLGRLPDWDEYSAVFGATNGCEDFNLDRPSVDVDY